MMSQPDHWKRPVKKKRSEFLGLLLVLAVAIGIWLLNGRDPGTPTAEPITPDSSTSASLQPSERPTFDSNGAVDSGDPVSGVDPDSGLPLIDERELPDEAIDVLGRIDAGGPFRYDKDGSRFGNFEGILPDEYDGYYAEYTVDTPGLSHRGARRIVTGDGGEYYWTQDHYESFSRIVR